VSTPEDPKYSSDRRVRVRPGDRIKIRVELTPYGSSNTETQNLSVLVPGNARGGGSLFVRGGNENGGFFFIGGARDASGSGSGGFDSLLSKLADADHGNDLVAQLVMRGLSRDEGKVRRTLSDVVQGRKFFFIEVVGRNGGGGGSSGGGCGPKVCHI
jgi:hypothetical protein